MLRRILLILAFVATPAWAKALTYEEWYLDQLNQMGFVQFEVTHTLLGRVRIVATSDEYVRELVFIPRTGEILRDYWTDLEGNPVVGMPLFYQTEVASQSGSNKGSGSSGSGNSGSGGGGSSGSGGSDDDGHEEEDRSAEDGHEEEPDEPDEPDEDESF